MVKKFYLAHNFELRKQIRKWELQMESKYNIEFDNPFYDNATRCKDIKNGFDKSKNFNSEKYYLENHHSIVNDDLEKIRKSDGIVAMAEQVRIGTPMEIFFAAYVLKIPVFIITKKWTYHPWILEYATAVFSTKQAFEDYIKIQYGLKEGL